MCTADLTLCHRFSRHPQERTCLSSSACTCRSAARAAARPAAPTDKPRLRQPGPSTSIAESPAGTNGLQRRTTHAAPPPTARSRCVAPDNRKAPTPKAVSVTARATRRSHQHAALHRPTARASRAHPGQPSRMPHAKLRRRQHQERRLKTRRTCAIHIEMLCHQPMRPYLDLGQILDIDRGITRQPRSHEQGDVV